MGFIHRPQAFMHSRQSNRLHCSVVAAIRNIYRSDYLYQLEHSALTLHTAVSRHAQATSGENHVSRIQMSVLGRMQAHNGFGSIERRLVAQSTQAEHLASALLAIRSHGQGI
jgi:hypothetical protein